ncbi:hypothetical protein V3W47_19010 [Deinococcus sp. YIM 134068]|uniref:hypothetical protein n=1 Tax=Deinococcus lichenicola TaxID=3118910 RepID=UPI002F9346B5
MTVVADYVGVANLVTGVVTGIGNVVNPYIYTDQEKATDGLTGAQLANQQNAINAEVTITQAREETTQKAITYGLAGILGVSCVYLASRLIGK